MKLVLNIRGSEGYAPDQVKSHFTVGDLKDWLEGYDDDTEIIIKDFNNQYGASYGIALNGDVDYSDEEDY